MRCMKCGVQIPDQEAFCADCLAEMKKHPVRSNVPIQLPPREAAPAAKKKARRHRDNKPEELLRRQRLTIRCLSVALAVTFLCFALSVGLLLQLLIGQNRLQDIGQNYGTATTQPSDP